MEAISLLLEHGFTKTGVNEFSKGKRYKAVLWKNGSVTIIQYTPKVRRLLYSTTFNNYKSLQSELIKNHS